MANYSKKYKAFFDEKKQQAEKYDTIVKVLFDAGIIDSMEQKALYNPEKIRKALDLYVLELIRQEENKSTASANKYLEVANRVRYALAHKRPMAIYDFSCRSCQKSDMVVMLEGRQVKVECKSGCGELVHGVDHADTWAEMEKFADSDELIVWYYNLNRFDYTAENALDELDYLPYVCMTKGELFNAFITYDEKKPGTWFHENKRGTAINIQTYTDKKRAWVDGLSETGLDWTSIRDDGEQWEK